jgi:fumarate reductase subunit C
MDAKIGPRPYVRALPRVLWFTRRPRYVRYMTREFSCFFIAAYSVLMVVGLAKLAAGPAAWQAFLEALRSPASIAFHVVALAFSVYHSITWFNLTPKAIPLGFISAVHYAGWVVLSLAVLVLAGVV